MAKLTNSERALRLLDGAYQRSAYSAYAITGPNGYAGRVVFKYPRDGAGRLQVAVHYNYTGDDYGHLYGWASGYGYDKQTAAMAGMEFLGVRIANRGERWDAQLRNAGFQVWNIL